MKSEFTNRYSWVVVLPRICIHDSSKKKKNLYSRVVVLCKLFIPQISFYQWASYQLKMTHERPMESPKNECPMKRCYPTTHVHVLKTCDMDKYEIEMVWAFFNRSFVNLYFIIWSSFINEKIIIIKSFVNGVNFTSMQSFFGRTTMQSY